jgi:hypothetical protein
MDTSNAQQQPATDDQELAKVLEGADKQLEDVSGDKEAGLQFEEAPVPPPITPLSAPATANPVKSAAPAAGSSNLADIKKGALEQLRPLVSKLDLPADEKFDTLLLIIRSTDDQSLVSPAYQAAKDIPDETKRAQALLDVIKEIDYFSSPQK